MPGSSWTVISKHWDFNLVTDAKTPLEQAPEHIKLAVDLIMLLEQHQLPPDIVLKALALVKQDYIAKQRQQQQSGCE